MKTMILSLMGCLILATGLAHPQSAKAQQAKARVTGHITGLEDGVIHFNYTADGEHQSDSVVTKDGRFVWEADIAEPQKMYIMFPNRYFDFFVEPGDMEITGSADALHALKVSGSALQDEADAFERSLKDLTDREQPLYQQYGKGTDAEQRALEETLQAIRAEKRARGAEYIRNHPASRFSLSLVQDRAAMGAYEDIKPLYELLSPSMRASAGGKQLEERLEVLKRSAIGEQMLNFTQNDMEGKPVHFADFKGKYVLVDFWASWCGPCRAENPNVLKEYNKYKDKGFTVVGVSLDEHADRWKKAVEEDGMPWTQVSDLKGWENEVSTYYGIRGIPSTLLVDPQGKIIAKDLRGELLAKKLEELFN